MWELLKSIGLDILKGSLANTFNKTKSIDTAINHILLGTDKIVKERIKQNEIRKCKALAESTTWELKSYMNVPNPDRLNIIIDDARDLVSMFKVYKHETYKEYILACTLYLLAREESLKLYPNEKKNIIAFINSAIKHIDQMNKKWRELSDKRFKSTWKNVTYGKHDQYRKLAAVKEGDTVITKWYATSDEMREKKKEIRESRYQKDVVKEYIEPAKRVTDLWKKRAEQLQKL